MDATPRPRRLPLALLVPGLTLAFLIAELGLRMLPFDRVSFRAWEAMALQSGVEQPFLANHRYENPASYGDLAALCNRPEFRHPRPEVFTTDRWGFRNPPGLLDEVPMDALLLGDSFVVGAGISDEETLSAQLSRLSGRKVYNGAGYPILKNNRLSRISEGLRLKGGIVFYEFLEHWLHDRQGEAEVVPSQPKVLERFLRLSRLRILAAGFMKSLHNDVLLPNTSSTRALPLVLSNGETMLFLPSDVRSHQAGGRKDYSTDELVTLSKEVHARGLSFAVILVPYKYSIYGSRVKNGVPPIPDALSVVEAGLRAAGIPVLNLSGALKDEAARLYPSGRYVYWQDDTHWNAAGIRRAAEEIAAFWKSLDH